MANEGFHEAREDLSEETRDMHRAIQSLMEELEAVDWYNQRVDACTDEDLKAILIHNRDEEKEHAAMVLEWIRRRDTKLPTHRVEAQHVRQLEPRGDAHLGKVISDEILVQQQRQCAGDCHHCMLWE